MKRYGFRVLGPLSLLLLVATFATGVWSWERCGSIGFKTAGGFGYRVYLMRGQFVFVETRDLIGIFHGPRQGLFPRPQGFFSCGVDNVPESSAPDFHLRIARAGVLLTWLAQIGFQSGGFEKAWMGGGPIGGFNLPPFPTADLQSYAIPIWFPALALVTASITWFILRGRRLAAGSRGFPVRCEEPTA